MTIVLYAFVFTLAYAVATLLLLRAGDRGRQAISDRAERDRWDYINGTSDRVSTHELAHARYSAPYGSTFEAVPTTAIDDIRAISELYLCPICENLRMECTCYKSEGIN